MIPVVIGVAGGTGSGKTTVANRILEQVGAEHIAYIPHDAYYKDLRRLPPEERANVNFDHPDSLDTELMAIHLRALRAGEAVQIPQYDFTTHTRATETVKVAPAPIIIVEGILIFAEPELRELFDMRLYVDTAADIRLIRRLERDVQDRGRTFQAVIAQYLRTVRPMHLEFVEPSKRYADVIIPQGGFNKVAIKMVAAQIRGLLEDGN
ncbi:MAG: uridine kinase [Chloroflexota bacterium]|nr:uridine kinase [Chloroflexota bacterium]